MGLVAMVVVWFLILFEFGCDYGLWLKWWFGSYGFDFGYGFWL